MSTPLALLHYIESFMLIVEDPHGIWCQQQTGGVNCYQDSLRGLLAPLDMDADNIERISHCWSPSGTMGITSEIADIIDALLAAKPSSSFLKVDRARLDESWEAWIYVLIDAPADPVSISSKSTPVSSDASHHPLTGFGAAKGVLTWPNSD